MECSASWKSAQEVAPFVDQMVQYFDRHEGVQRRLEDRRSVAVPLQVRALDDLWEPVGDPVDAVTRNIAHGGVGFYHSTPIDGPFVEIGLTNQTGAQIKLVAEIRHTTMIGRFMYSGARFLFGGDDSQ